MKRRWTVFKSTEQGATVLWVVEEDPLQVLGVADWVFVLEGGAVKTSCAASELLAAPNFHEIFLAV